MKVVVGGNVWLPIDDLSAQQILNIKESLTIYPKKTTDIATKADPKPIYMYDEKEDFIGVPRAWYKKKVTKEHDEILKISYGSKMSAFTTRYQATGNFIEQEAVIRTFLARMDGKKWDGFLLKAGCAFGKALKNGEPVLTSNGYIPIEKLTVNDMVAGTDGNFYNVTGVYSQGIRDLYRIKFTDNTYIDCDGDHLWTFVIRRRKGKVVTIKTKDLFLSDLREKSGRLFWLPDISPVDFGRNDILPIDPYTLGVILGDGNISDLRSVYITTEDFDIINNCKFPPGNRFVRRKDNSGRATTYRISQDVSSSKMFKNDSLRFRLKSIGLMGCNSHDKFIPDIYEYASINNRLSLLRGLFDADGYPISSGIVEYTTVSKVMADSVFRIVNSLGGTCINKYRKTKYTKKDGSKSKWFYSYRLIIKLPKNMNPHSLYRKKCIINNAKWQRKIGRAVDSVCKIGSDEATCISVNSPDHLFLTKNCIPTHNTATSLEFARRVGRKTLIIVHKEFFLKQWKNRIKKFMPDAKVGIIRQNKCEFEDCDFVIAMLQSLVRDKDSHRYPERIYKSEFGIVISDECHRIAASSWSSVLPRFNAAWRVGLTATPRRKDGAQDVFFNHISDVTYSAKTKAQVPGLRVLKTYSCLKPIRRGNYYVSVDNLNSAQILTQLGKDQFRAKDIVDQLVLAVQNGRKIIVVSERLYHLKLMSDMLMNSLFDLDLPFEPTIDFCTGEWFSGEVWEESNSRHKKGDPKMVKRTEADFDKAERANVIFATKQSIEEGFDVEALDVLVLSMPMGDIEQIVGRARRWCYQDKEKCEHYCPWRVGNCKEKPKPIIVDVVDENIPQLLPKWRRRQKFYRKIGTEVS
jgi:hypothetical protein